jgi:hypothetical protein
MSRLMERKLDTECGMWNAEFGKFETYRMETGNLKFETWHWGAGKLGGGEARRLECRIQDTGFKLQNSGSIGHYL